MKTWRTMSKRRRRRIDRDRRNHRDAQAEAERIRRERFGWRAWLQTLGLPFQPSPVHEAIWEYLLNDRPPPSPLKRLRHRTSSVGFYATIPVPKRRGVFPTRRSSRYFIIVDDIDVTQGE